MWKRFMPERCPCAACTDTYKWERLWNLQIKELRRDKEELLASLELFYRVFFLNEETEHA